MVEISEHGREYAIAVQVASHFPWQQPDSVPVDVLPAPTDVEEPAPEAGA
jgi:hypothetical protein